MIKGNEKWGNLLFSYMKLVTNCRGYGDRIQSEQHGGRSTSWTGTRLSICLMRISSFNIQLLQAKM